jgi:hypothetical protein
VPELRLRLRQFVDAHGNATAVGQAHLIDNVEDVHGNLSNITNLPREIPQGMKPAR